MTKHPCEGMTRSEITAFEAIAINHQPRCSKKTIDTLVGARCHREGAETGPFGRWITAIGSQRLLRAPCVATACTRAAMLGASP
jgi:hypothetical protein